MDKVLLKIEGLSKSFGENVVLKDINLEVKPGEIGRLFLVCRLFPKQEDMEEK